jgi:pimeloyl-ACP methyl ester carboxylesterase
MLLKLHDGRNLFYEIYGDPLGIPCFYFHGFPGSHLQAQIADAQGKKNGVKVIATDRPGLGFSDYDPRRTIKSTVEDIAELADHLRHDKFHVIGVSGGAPYALASSIYLHGRIKSLVLICPLGPLWKKEFKQAFPVFARLGIFGVQKVPFFMKKLYRQIILQFDKNPEKYLAMMAKKLSLRDQEATQNPTVKTILRNSFCHSYRQHPQYALIDVQIYARDWGFEISDITIPTFLWHGTADKVVPYKHSVLLHNAISNSEFFTFQDEGHYSVAIEKLPEIMSKLKAIQQ